MKRIVARWPSAPPVDIALLLQGNCTDAQIDSFLQRVTDAQQKGHDAYGLTTDQLQAMLQLIIQKYTYNDSKDLEQTEDIHFEAENLQKLVAYLEGIEVPYPSPPAKDITTIDGVTAHALLEFTRGSGTGKVAQLTKYWKADTAMFGSRPMIFYGPNISRPTTYQMIQETNALAGSGPSIPVYVITNGGIATNDPSLSAKLSKLGIDIPVYGITNQEKWTNVTYPSENGYKPVPVQVPAEISLNDILRMLGMPL